MITITLGAHHPGTGRYATAGKFAADSLRALAKLLVRARTPDQPWQAVRNPAATNLRAIAQRIATARSGGRIRNPAGAPRVLLAGPSLHALASNPRLSQALHHPKPDATDPTTKSDAPHAQPEGGVSEATKTDDAHHAEHAT